MTSPTLSGNERRAPVEFSASAWGYTKLWLVNLVLTVITLGVYGAWAKVRNNQYLFGHTQIEKHRLEYLAVPMKILMGRILATALFLIAWSATSLIPEAIIVFYLALLFAMPWLVVQGLRFTETLIGTGMSLGENAFSRDMEREADEFARTRLVKAGISDTVFANALQKITQAYPSDAEASANNWLEYFSSHPAPESRIYAR